MKKKLRCIDILTSDGKVLFSLRIYDRENTVEEKTDVTAGQQPVLMKETGKEQAQEPAKEKESEKAHTDAKQKEPDNGSPKTASSSLDEPAMTDAQKRFLFRLLVDQGVEGEQAHDRLKSLFQVTALTEVTKLEASKMIERLIEENKGGGKNHGTSVQ